MCSVHMQMCARIVLTCYDNIGRGFVHAYISVYNDLSLDPIVLGLSVSLLLLFLSEKKEVACATAQALLVTRSARSLQAFKRQACNLEYARARPGCVSKQLSVSSNALIRVQDWNRSIAAAHARSRSA